ncbi:MAG: helix-turn-helix transcriptional regulator [Lachnospiraceae bacterium]|nr:helix-turn-helix transcriptional regulator [Lachnospiraceae bacterium]
MKIEYFNSEDNNTQLGFRLTAAYAVEADSFFDVRTFAIFQRLDDDHYLIIRNLRGNVYIVLDDKVFHIEREGLISVRANSVRKMYSDEEGCKLVIMEYIRSSLLYMKMRIGKLYHLPLDESEITIRRMLLQTCNNPTEQECRYASTFFSALMIHWQRKYHELIKSDSEKRVLKIAEKIANAPEDDYNITEEAERCELSERRFRDVFIETTGFSPKEYMIKKRLDKAIAYLLLTDMKMADIAIECGYADPLYFSRVFKNKTGYSPMEFREIMK